MRYDAAPIRCLQLIVIFEQWNSCRCRGKVQCNRIRELRMAPGNQAVQQKEPSKKLQYTVFVYKYTNMVYLTQLFSSTIGWICHSRLHDFRVPSARVARIASLLLPQCYLCLKVLLNLVIFHTTREY